MSPFTLMQRPLLIIDNSSDDRVSLRRQLKKFGDEFPHVIEFEDGESALAWLKDNQARCCLVDYQLPGLDGLMFLKALRCTKDSELLPVVVMTGQGDEKLAVEMLQSGAQDYLVKGDITAEKLYRAIKTAIKSCELQYQLYYLAHYDALTGLLNRGLFMDRLQQVVSLCDRYHSGCALLYLDVDNFKKINDSLGHDAGDFVLKVVADRIKDNCRRTDSAARLGSDEFVILVDRIDPVDSHNMAKKILLAVDAPIQYDGRELIVCASIGVAIYPETASSAEELLKQADSAMYQAKRQGGGRCMKFQPLNLQNNSVTTKEQDFTAALHHGDLRLCYHPVVSLGGMGDQSTRLVVDPYWQREHARMSHSQLCDMAERSATLEDYQRWLLTTVLDQWLRWRDDSGAHVYLDLPAERGHDEASLQLLFTMLEMRGIDPVHIGLIWSQEDMMRHPAVSARLLAVLREHGCRALMSDFGEGCLSIAHLSEFALEAVQLPTHRGGAVESAAKRADDCATHAHHNMMRTARALIDLAHSLGLKVCATGVVDNDSAKALRQLSCDYAMGGFVDSVYPGDTPAFIVNPHPL